MQQIYKETISPNKDYTKKKKDIVHYTIEVYQNSDHLILVNAKSNSGFFEPLQYQLETEKTISKSDVSIEWTTLMGNPNPTQEDQLCIAYVSISQKEKLLSKRKINFINRGIEMIEDTLGKK